MTSDESGGDTPRPDVPTASFYDDRNAMGRWFTRLRDLDVPTPESQPLPLDHDTDGLPDWDTQLASEIVENLGGKAFVRGEFSSAYDLTEGSYIQSPAEGLIDQTIAILVSDQSQMALPVGYHVWIREWLDLDWNHYSNYTFHPEVRTFLRDGEVICYHPRLEWADKEAAAVAYSERAALIIDDHWDDQIRPYAERIAEEFDGDGWYSADFVLTTDDEWYCTDMALDALYDHDERPRGGDGWLNISNHPGECEHDLERLVPQEVLADA